MRRRLRSPRTAKPSEARPDTRQKNRPGMSQQKDSEEQGMGRSMPSLIRSGRDPWPKSRLPRCQACVGSLTSPIQSDCAVEALAIRGPCPGMTLSWSTPAWSWGKNGPSGLNMKWSPCSVPQI